MSPVYRWSGRWTTERPKKVFNVITKFNISFINKHGDRVLLGTNQGRFFKETREEAEKALQSMLTPENEGRWRDIYGEQAVGTFRVDPFECYENGDATGIYVKEVLP